MLPSGRVVRRVGPLPTGRARRRPPTRVQLGTCRRPGSSSGEVRAFIHVVPSGHASWLAPTRADGARVCKERRRCLGAGPPDGSGPGPRPHWHASRSDESTYLTAWVDDVARGGGAAGRAVGQWGHSCSSRAAARRAGAVRAPGGAGALRRRGVRGQLVEEEDARVGEDVGDGGGVQVIDVDEHVWRHTRRGDRFVSVVIDLTPVRDKTGPSRLLAMVEGRSKPLRSKTCLA